MGGTNQVYIANSETLSFSPSLGDMTAFQPNGHPPVGVDVTQSAAGGTGGRFTFHASDDNGFGYIAQMMLQVGNPSVNGCMFMYYPTQNFIQIFNDAGTNWVDYATLGNGTGPGATVANSQCALDVAGATKTGSGNDLRVTLPIAFMPGYAGTQNLRILSLIDRANMRQDYFTQSWGTFLAGGTVSLSSAGESFGFGGGTKTVNVSAGSGVGWVALSQAVAGANVPYPTWLHVLSGGSGVGNGVLEYSVAANSGAARTATIVVAGAVLTITQDGAGSGTVSSMAGPTWTVPVPVAGTPREAQFVFTTKGTTGPVDSMQVLVNWGVAQQGGCVIYFSKTNNGMQLWNDAVGSWVGWTGFGGTDIAGERCTVLASRTTVTDNGNNSITLATTIVFNTNFLGANVVAVFNQDVHAVNSPWEIAGTVTAFAASGHLPVAVDASPATGYGMGGTIGFHASDDNGAGYITQAMVQAGDPGTTSAGAGCMFMYYPGSRAIQLFNDGGTNWIDVGAKLGFAGNALGNSQCVLDATAGLDASVGNDLRFNLPLTFSGGYMGVKALKILALWAGNGTW